MASTSLDTLLAEVRACTICAAHLPHGVRPVVQANSSAHILIAAQAPGRKVHASGLPFDDASGDRLRNWMGVSREVFYNPKKIALVPMGFCYPGSGTSGDYPPRPECAPAWRGKVLQHLTNLDLVLVIGQYAQDYHLERSGRTLTEIVHAWRDYWPKIIPLPHPSPRNNIWLRRNPWFEAEVVPLLRERVEEVLFSVDTDSTHDT